jgi:hypothetical protein
MVHTFHGFFQIFLTIGRKSGFFNQDRNTLFLTSIEDSPGQVKE